MEPVFLLVLSLLLATAGAETKEAVLDTDGNALQQGRQYHVLPSIWARGGGLRMSRLNGSCPPNVVQRFSEVKNGEPLMFFPEVPSDEGGVVRVSELVYILFPRPNPCPQSTMWRRDNGGYITTGGTASTIMGPHDSRFAIVKSSSAIISYNIRFCPCRVCRLPCRTVGVNDVNGKRLLTVVGSEANAHEVVFARVRDEDSTNILPATMLGED
ncbi:Kunitz family serine protease inhibitor [Streptococcus anginosus]|uniref:Kunitz family serine protease inhibitor n=1 Tax=Streptococcus anginosus TaxID=1328 RepID=UPI00398CF18F